MADTSAQALITAQRFGLGVGVGGFTDYAGDVRGALHAEIEAGPRLIPVGAAPDQTLKSSPDLLQSIYVYQDARKMERAKAPPPALSPGMARTDAMASMGSAPNSISAQAQPKSVLNNPVRATVIAELEARFNGAYQTPLIGFNERLVMFWANHFAVSLDKGEAVAMTAGAFEREAIRPHIFGSFHDLLLAVESHPCMLIYLDNQQSIGPNARANRNGKRGLNENLAREILELHTLGVGGGYSQADVTAFARVITGWGLIGRNARFGEVQGSFHFNDGAHEPGTQTLLGRTYEDNGVDQGRRVLADLARHPATAKHVATKLVRHFISDDPPPALVKRLSEAWMHSEGDLSLVYRALIDAPEALTPARTKMRTPQEYMAALLRLAGTRPKGEATAAALKAMGQPLWTPGGPNGFSDLSTVWTSPEALSTRIEVANLAAEKLGSDLDARDLFAARMGPALSETTKTAIARAESRAQGLAIGLLSPEFMRR